MSSKDGKPIGSVSISIVDCNTKLTESFTISKPDGKFQIEIKENLDSICVSFSHISHTPVFKKISTLSGSLEIILQAKETIDLPEVMIKSQGFIKSGDTLKFSVSNFDQNNFRAIGDVIKNIPGIVVSQSGEISYNGKAISNYYIEGLDLLEERYRLANENLPKGMVEQVQILLRHQPIRILDSVSKGNNIAINLKLKQDAKNKLINSVGLAAGFADDKFLYSLNVLSVLFSKKLQMLFSNKANNTGNDLKPEITGFRLSDISRMSSFFLKEDLVQVIKPQNPPFASNVFFNNKSIAPSVNLLKKISKYGELKLNSNYVNQSTILANQLFTHITTGNQIVRIEEINKFTGIEHIVKSGMQYNYNSPKLYLKSETKLLLFSAIENNTTTGITTLQQRAKVPAQNFTQTLRGIKTKTKIIYSAGVLFSYSSFPQSLNIFPGIFPDVFNLSIEYREFIQKINHQSVRSYQYFSASKKSQKFIHSLLFSAEWKNEKLNRNILKDSQAVITPLFSYRQFKWEQLNFTTSIEQKYQSDKFDCSVLFPFFFSRNTFFNHKFNQRTILIINPELSAEYRISDFSRINVDIRREAGFASFINAIPFAFFQTYRSQTEGLSENLPFEKNVSMNINYSYTNIIKRLFFSVSFNTEHLQQNYTPLLAYDGILEKISLKSSNNLQQRNTFSIKLSQKFEPIKTTLQIRANLLSKQFNQLNTTSISAFSTRQAGVYGSLNFKKIKNIIIDISQQLSVTYFKSANLSYKLSGKTGVTDVSVNLFLLKEKLIIGTQQKIYNNSGLNNINQFVQIDLIISYRHKKNDIQINCINLLNKKLYSEYQTFANIQTWSQYKLLGRQILFTYNFVF